MKCLQIIGRSNTKWCQIVKAKNDEGNWWRVKSLDEGKTWTVEPLLPAMTQVSESPNQTGLRPRAQFCSKPYLLRLRTGELIGWTLCLDHALAIKSDMKELGVDSVTITGGDDDADQS